MDGDIERRLSDGPKGEKERAALRVLLTLRGQGRTADEIAAGLKAETGFDLSPEAVTRVLEKVAGPLPAKEGVDPAYFSGWLGGG